MIKFFSNYKIVFYSINFSLIFLYLFPGSLIGQVLYGSKKIQPQITPDFIISSILVDSNSKFNISLSTNLVVSILIS